MTTLEERLKELTKNNDHTGWLIEVARYNQNCQQIKAAQAIKILHSYMGYMSGGLLSVRNVIEDAIKKELNAKIGQEAADKIFSTH